MRKSLMFILIIEIKIGTRNLEKVKGVISKNKFFPTSFEWFKYFFFNWIEIIAVNCVLSSCYWIKKTLNDKCIEGFDVVPAETFFHSIRFFHTIYIF